MPILTNIKEFKAQENPFTDQELIGKTDHEIKQIIFGKRVINILDKFFGPEESFKYDSTYKIYMSQAFVKQTQYKPLPLDNDDLRLLLAENPRPHVVYACPVGHLHSAGDCGIPIQISLCGFDGCKLFVGGLYHLLVPGSYIVYHDGYGPAKIWYGYFPVDSYRIYKRLVNQANTAKRQMNPPEPEIILQPQTQEELDQERLIVARPLQADDNILNMYIQHKAVDCKVCGDDIILGDDNLYILPVCGHLIHRDDVEGYRGERLQESQSVVLRERLAQSVVLRERLVQSVERLQEEAQNIVLRERLAQSIERLQESQSSSIK